VAHKSPDHRALGAAIRSLRTQQDLAQEELAHRSGLHRTYMGDVERGERNLSFRNLLKICTGLGVTFTELATEYDRQRTKRPRSK
jgi:transcriptional regulator with XRE-family HTH domain